MSINDRIFKPRRGTKSTFTNTELEGNKSNTILAEGEIFFEVPDTGQGTGRVRVKMGDGITEYNSLPYAIPFTEDEIIVHQGTDDKTITASSSIQSSSIATNLNNAKSGNTLKSIIHNLREAIYKCACDISYLDSNKSSTSHTHSGYASASHTHDSRYYTETEINGFRSYIGMIIFSTVLSTESDVISQYGGTTWIQHSGYVLRGATSGVTTNSATKTGGNDNMIVPYHKHDITVSPSGASFVTSYAGSGSWIGSGASAVGVQGKISVNYAGTSGNTTNANIPNYKSVYIWERTA